MPTYEYECKSCGYTFDVFQSMKDDPLKDCPQCGGSVHRLINGGGGVIFKGSGFYVTDKKAPASKAPAKAAADGKADKPAPCASECPKADTCPAAQASASAPPAAKKASGE